MGLKFSSILSNCRFHVDGIVMLKCLSCCSDIYNFFEYSLMVWTCCLDRLTIAQAKLVDDKQKLLQGAGGKLQLQL